MEKKLRDILSEAKKKNGPKNGKMLKKLHELDDRIEEFVDSLEDKIMSIEDNPVFVKKAQQLLANMSKEYSEFIMALRAVVNSVDRKGQMIPSIDTYESQVRDANDGAGQEPPPEEEPPPEDDGGDGGDDDEFELKVAKKGKGKKKSSVKEALERI